jgi:methionine-rich copper-binding protein CopC
MRNTLLKITASLAFALAASAAFAHAQLEKSTPAVGSTVSPPNQIQLEFSEGVEPKFSGVTVTGPGGAAALGAPSVETGHQNVLIVPVVKSLSPGVYTVKWRAISIDTHHTQGTFEFTVK